MKPQSWRRYQEDLRRKRWRWGLNTRGAGILLLILLALLFAAFALAGCAPTEPGETLYAPVYRNGDAFVGHLPSYDGGAD